MTAIQDTYLQRLADAGYDHVEAELLHGRHAAVFVWQSFRRTEGRSFGGLTLNEALGKALVWAEQNGSDVPR